MCCGCVCFRVALACATTFSIAHDLRRDLSVCTGVLVCLKKCILYRCLKCLCVFYSFVCCVAASAHVGGAKFVAYVAESSRDLFCAYTRPRGVYVHPWMCTVSFGIRSGIYGGCTSLVCT
jgi:hypothetical protein